MRARVTRRGRRCGRSPTTSSIGRQTAPISTDSDPPSPMIAHSGASASSSTPIAAPNTTYATISPRAARPKYCMPRSASWQAFTGQPSAMTAPSRTNAPRASSRSASGIPNTDTSPTPPPATSSPARTPSAEYTATAVEKTASRSGAALASASARTAAPSTEYWTMST